MEAVSVWDADDDRVRVYLSGPMTGMADYNRPAFAAAAADLERQGFAVYNPGAHDALDGLEDGVATHRDYMARDLPAVMGADLVYVLPGWGASVGARLEVHTALVCGLEVRSYPDGLPVEGLPEADGCACAEPAPPPGAPAVGPSPIEAAALEHAGTPSPGAWRVTDPTTGGQKDAKPARLSLVPMDALLAVAEVFHHGATKYADHNWCRGYAWSLSFDALHRHLAAFWQGEDRDPESGQPHVAHAAWHALVLLAFQLRDVGTDDRPHVQLAALRGDAAA